MNSYANVLDMLLNLQHYSLPCSLYKIKVEERLDDLLQNDVRMHQITFFFCREAFVIYRIPYISDKQMLFGIPRLYYWYKDDTTLILDVICCSSAVLRFLPHKNYWEQLYHTLLMKHLSASPALHSSLCYPAAHEQNACCFLSCEHLQDLPPLCLLQYMKYALQTWAIRFYDAPTKARKIRHSQYKGWSQWLAAFLFS